MTVGHDVQRGANEIPITLKLDIITNHILVAYFLKAIVRNSALFSFANQEWVAEVAVLVVSQSAQSPVSSTSS